MNDIWKQKYTHYGDETNLKQDSDGKLYETVKFSNGIEEQHYSDKLHKLNFIADKNGLDLDNYKDFQRAEEILKEKGKPDLSQMSYSAKDVYDILTSKKGGYFNYSFIIILLVYCYKI